VIKSRGAKGTASVTFTLDPCVGAQTAAVCGDWNDWSAGTDVMRRDAAGGFSLTVDLQAGRIYRFRYLLDGERWDNDWAADAYVPNSFGGDDSVVDLTALAETVPSAAKKGTAKKGTAKKGTAKKKTAKKKTAKKKTAKKKTAKKKTAKKKTAKKKTAKKAAPVQATKKTAAPTAKRARKTAE